MPENRSSAAAALWLLDGRDIGPEELALFAETLGASEARRLMRFARPERGRQFLLGRMLLRLAMASLTGVSADALGIIEQSGQTPRLSFPKQRSLSPRFSISHSREWVVCAASLEANLGVDIEVRDPSRDINAIAEVVFDRYERRWLASRSDGDQLAGFYDLWCTKEARYKLRCNVQRKHHAHDGAVHRTRPWYRYILSLPDLSVVLVSDRPCLELRAIMLHDLNRVLDGSAPQGSFVQSISRFPR